MQSGAVRTSTAAAPHSSAVLKGKVVHCLGEVVAHWISPLSRRPSSTTSIRIAFGKSSGCSFHQVDPLSCPEEDPLACLDIAGYRPQAESHVKRIDAQGAPERQFSELMLQRMAAAGCGAASPPWRGLSFPAKRRRADKAQREDCRSFVLTMSLRCTTVSS
jgi:hypothetical protein